MHHSVSQKYCPLLNITSRLYSLAHLVHGDLSEYNILIAPASTIRVCNDTLSEKDMDELQVVFIDFGQTVDYKHPGALELLDRDIERVNKFFEMQGVEVISRHAMVDIITGNEGSKELNNDLS